MSTPSNMYNARDQLNQAGFDGAASKLSKKSRRRRNKKLREDGGPAVSGAEEPSATTPVVAMEDDMLVMPGQTFAVVSFVDKRDYTGTCEGDSASTGRAVNIIKIRGVFPTHERAAARVKELMTVDPYFDIHIVKCGTWTTIGAGNGEDVTYENEGVQDIMSAFFDKHYTDMDNLKSRISDAKGAGMANLDANDPQKFFDAAQTVGDDKPAEALPEGALRMSAQEAVESLVKSTAGVTSGLVNACGEEDSVCWESDEE